MCIQNTQRVFFHKYAALFLFVLFTSCELTVDIDVPFEQQKLVLNSFFNTDSVWAATLSANQHILDTLYEQRVENALIVVYHAGAAVDTLMHLSDGVYRADTGKPLPGKSYEIKAMAPGYPDVTSHSYVPLPTLITDIQVTKGASSEGYPEDVFHVKFQDDPLVENFYQIYVEGESDYIDFETAKIRKHRFRLGMATNDPSVRSNEYSGFDGIFIKDVLFTNGNGAISFTTQGQVMDFYSYVIVTIRTLSKDYYNYKTTGRLQEDISDNPFAQPINVYNNIDNGFGIFAGFSASHYFAGEPRPRPVITSISPLRAAPLDTVVISGENFLDVSPHYGSVIFTASGALTYASPVRTTPNEIVVLVPRNAITGKIFVSNASWITPSDIEFEVIN
jgi:hypothetical protein